MTDPLDRLSEVPSATPDLAAIRARARRLTSRRRAMVGSAAALIAVAALAGALRPWEAPDTARLAEAPPSVQTPPARASIEVGPDETQLDTTVPEATEAPLAPDGSARGRLSSDTAPAGSGSQGGGDLEMSLILAKSTVAPGEELEMKLRACNTGGDAVEAWFASGQRHDFEAYRSGDDRPAWRWSSGQFFSQATGTERWKPGECKDFEGTWSGRDEQGRLLVGRYRVVGMLVTSPERRSASEEVCLGTCPA